MDKPILQNLSTVQAKVLLSLASGDTVTSAAQIAGVGRTTIYDWLRTQPHFSAVVDLAKGEYILTLRDQMHDLAAKALSTLTAILDDLSAPASVRCKAALAILNRPHFPDQGWHLPEKIDAPQSQPNTSEHNFANSEPTAPPATNEAIQTNLNTPERENENPHQTATVRERTPSHVGRNAPCPCNSGKRYRRCCLNKPRTGTPAAQAA